MWTLAYWAIARLAAAYLAGGPGQGSAYVRGSFRGPDFLPGLSDIDLVVVLPSDRGRPCASRGRAMERWQRLRRALPVSDLVLDYPRIYDERELRDVAGKSALTSGLDGAANRRAERRDGDAASGATRMLERPGLYGATVDWRPLAGRDRRPAERDRDDQDTRLAAWLELVYWWRWVFPVCVDPSGPRTAPLCLKLVTEPVRIWLWLALGERTTGREEALRRGLRALPEEESALRAALRLHRSLPGSPDPPLAEVLPVLIRLSERIAALIEAAIADRGVVEVGLGRACGANLLLAFGGWKATPGARDPRLLPLCDWRGLVWPRRPDDAFALLPGDPSNPAVLAALASSQDVGPYPALRAQRLLVLPAATRARARLRAVQCAASDPVSFAVAAGENVASFPDVRGWSAADSARRAVAEHKARLHARPSSQAHAGGDALALLLTAARAALFLESLHEGEPQLALTVTEAARRLAARSPAAEGIAAEALERYRDFALLRQPPPGAVVSALRDLVLSLPVYARDGSSPRQTPSRARRSTTSP